MDGSEIKTIPLLSSSGRFYDIKMWDGVIESTSTFPYPYVCIKPDNTFLNSVEKTDFRVAVRITGTESSYDNKTVYGLVSTSGNVPNKRPVFYKRTGLWCIVLSTDWLGYPLKNGSLEVFYPEDTPDITEGYSNNFTDQSYALHGPQIRSTGENSD